MQICVSLLELAAANVSFDVSFYFSWAIAFFANNRCPYHTYHTQDWPMQ